MQKIDIWTYLKRRKKEKRKEHLRNYLKARKSNKLID